MKFYDVTVLVSEEMPVWPKDPAVALPLALSIARGDAANVTRIEMGAHTGTHFDAPIHFEPNGCGIDQLPLDVLVGSCRVFDLTAIPGHINRAVLAQCDLRGVTRALFKTRNSQLWARGEHAFNPKELGGIVSIWPFAYLQLNKEMDLDAYIGNLRSHHTVIVPGRLAGMVGAFARLCNIKTRYQFDYQ